VQAVGGLHWREIWSQNQISRPIVVAIQARAGLPEWSFEGQRTG
jgi:hypothetical protein